MVYFGHLLNFHFQSHLIIVGSKMDSPLLLSHQCELKHVAMEFGQVASILDYMNQGLKAMHESWEDLLLMMDSKLATYARVSCQNHCCKAVIINMWFWKENGFGSNFICK